MKISLITPIYKNASGLRKFLDDMNKQSNKNFEIVFSVDTNNDGVLGVIDEFKTLKSKIHLIYNSKRQGRTKAIKNAARLATGDYSIITSVTNSFKSNFVNDAVAVAKLRKTDIIEFKASFNKPKKFSGNLRKSFNKPVKIDDHPEIIALSYPFDFNKMYSTNLLKRIVDEQPLLEVNSRFSLSIVYKAIMMAETYSTASKSLVTSKAELTANFNPLKLIRQWGELFDYADNKFEGQYNPELMYARYFHEIVFLIGFVGLSKNKVLLKRVKDNFERSLKTDFAGFFESNKYALRKNAETKIIIENRTVMKLKKVFKDL